MKSPKRIIFVQVKITEMKIQVKQVQKRILTLLHCKDIYFLILNTIISIIIIII
jgi:hypothetical protein